jgi:hypothetical protein
MGWADGRRIASGRPRPEEFPCRGLSIGRIARNTFVFMAFLLINKAGLPGNAVFFLVIAFMMLSNTTVALMGFSSAVTALALNTAFVAKTIVFTFSRVLTLGALAGRFTLAGNTAFLRTRAYGALTLFCIIAALCSIVSGYYTHVALIKVVVFWVGMTGFFGVVAAIRQQRIDTTEWFVSQTLAVAILSFLSLLLGVARNFKDDNVLGTLHNLAFYHSNAAGPIYALIVLYLLNVVLFTRHRNRWICLPIAGFLAYCLWLTGSRTGVGSLLAGITITLVLAMVWGRGRRYRIRLNYSRTYILLVLFAVGLAIAATEIGTGGSLSSGLRSFVSKNSGDVEELNAEDVLSSRTGLIQQAWENFQRSPLVGIGFGVSTDPYFIANATLLYAPVEKGFLPGAVLEEVGLVGALAFLGFLGAMFSTLIRNRSIPGVAMFASFLISNLGEASFFALGGHASFMWLFVLGGVMLGDRCTTAVEWSNPRAKALRTAQ